MTISKTSPPFKTLTSAPKKPPPSSSVSTRHHIHAGLSALLLISVILTGAIISGIRMEQRYIHVITPELGRSKDMITDRSEGIQHLERVKNQGLALQREAFRQRDLLPL